MIRRNARISTNPRLFPIFRGKIFEKTWTAPYNNATSFHLFHHSYTGKVHYHCARACPPYFESSTSSPAFNSLAKVKHPAAKFVIIYIYIYIYIYTRIPRSHNPTPLGSMARNLINRTHNKARYIHNHRQGAFPSQSLCHVTCVYTHIYTSCICTRPSPGWKRRNTHLYKRAIFTAGIALSLHTL